MTPPPMLVHSMRKVSGRRKMCRYCNKAEDDLNFQKSLKSCSRCKQALYCSRECQQIEDGLEGTQTPLQGFTCICWESIWPSLWHYTVSNFSTKKIQEILANIAVVCIEIDWNWDKAIFTEPGKDGSKFRTVPFHDLLRENETQTNGACLSNECVQALKMHQSNRTSDQLLSVLKFPGGTFSISSVTSLTTTVRNGDAESDSKPSSKATKVLA